MPRSAQQPGTGRRLRGRPLCPQRRGPAEQRNRSPAPARRAGRRRPRADRVFGGMLNARGRDAARRPPWRRDAGLRRDHAHSARGHGSGLVEHDGVDSAGGLEDLWTPDQQAELGTPTGSGQQRRRRRQASAHGQATTRTEIAAVSAAATGWAATNHHPTKVSPASTRLARDRATRSASRCLAALPSGPGHEPRPSSQAGVCSPSVLALRARAVGHRR